MRPLPPGNWTPDDEQRWRRKIARFRLLHERIRIIAADDAKSSELPKLREEHDRFGSELESLWPGVTSVLKPFEEIATPPPADDPKAGSDWACGTVFRAVCLGGLALLLSLFLDWGPILIGIGVLASAGAYFWIRRRRR